MAKGVTKKKVGFSVDIKIYEKFEEYCDVKLINKSKLLNKIITDFVKSTEEKK